MSDAAGGGGGGGGGGDDATSRAERLAAARERLEGLKARLSVAHGNLDGDGEGMRRAVAEAAAPLRKLASAPKRRRTLEGHYGKVYNVNWGNSSEKVASCSQDGKLILWHPSSGRKLQMVPLRTAWVMTCALDLDQQKFAAVGGLDDMCTVYGLGGTGISTPTQELVGHEGYVSCCRFTDGATSIATSSGDGTCGFWDVTGGVRISKLEGHAGDVMCVSPSPESKDMLASGGCDSMAKVWDLRDKPGKCTHTFAGHESDVNAVQFSNDGKTVVTGSDDSTCRVFDMRRCGELNSFRSDKFVGSVTSVALTRSGRLMFAGLDNNQVYAYDVLAFEGPPVHSLRGHTGRVSCVSISPNGEVLASGSWDTTLGMWA